MMEYRGYVAKVECDDGAGVFHGEVLNLRDVITFEGKTVAELRKAFGRIRRTQAIIQTSLQALRSLIDRKCVPVGIFNGHNRTFL